MAGEPFGAGEAAEWPRKVQLQCEDDGRRAGRNEVKQERREGIFSQPVVTSQS